MISVFVAAVKRGSGEDLRAIDEAIGRLGNLFPGLAAPRPFVDPVVGLRLYAWVRLDNRTELAAQLGLRQGIGAAEDPATVLSAYLKWGPDCVARLEGDFSMVIVDPRDGSVFAARDPVGIRPLYISVTSDLVVASPSAAVFGSFCEVDTSVRSEWLADFVHGRSGDWRLTPFAGVRRVAPGHWIRVTNSAMSERRYHKFDGEAPWADTRDPAWLEAYRTELIRAVSVRTAPVGLTGVEISGGLDSSTILGVMAHARPERINDIHTFGFATAELEPMYILQTSLAHGIEHNHIFTNSPTESSNQRRGWQAIGYPAEHGNAVFHIPFYSLAATLGVTTLHSGHGGDETVTNSGGLAVQELIAQRNWGQALRDLPGPALLRPLRLAKRMRRRVGDVSHLTAPMLDRLWATPLRAEVFAERRIAARTFEAARYDAPYCRVNDFLLGDRISPMTSIRTADCSLVAASYGLDYRWALLDRRLIQQYLHTPVVWKYGEGYGRYLHRRALAGMVPDEVAWKQSKDMGGQRRPSLRQVSTADVSRHGNQDQQSAANVGAFLERLHPQVAELVDPSRVQRLLDAFNDTATDRTAAPTPANYLRSLLVLSDWMHDR